MITDVSDLHWMLSISSSHGQRHGSTFPFSIEKLTSTPSTWYFFTILQNVFVKKEYFVANPLLF
jgi:hypothetical protein